MTVLTLPYSAAPARLAGVVRRIPVTIGYLSLLALASWLLSRLDHDTRDSVVRHASTNLDNLGRLHVGTLLTSAFVMTSAPTLAWWCGIVALLAGVELRLGSRRLAFAFLAGHVGATLLVAAGLATGVKAGWVDGGVSGTVDVGVSYGLMAVIGLLVATLPARLQPLWAGLWLTAAGIAVSEGRDFTSVGHLLALTIGLLAAIRVRRRSRPVDGGGFGWTVAGGVAAGGALAWGSDLDGTGPVLVIGATVVAATLGSLLLRYRQSRSPEPAG
ncbi:MAG: rhomboid-like protein [Mycobacteriales bacterium]